MVVTHAMDQFNDPFFIGFNRELGRLNTAHKTNSQTYPPYDLLKLDEDTYRLSTALAGFTKEDINVSVEDIYNAFDDASEVTLPTKVLEKLENTEANKVKKGEMKKVIAIAKKYNKENPLVLKKALESGDYKRPLILKFGDRYHLVAGNTRLCTASAMGMKPKVLIGEI